MLLPMRCPGCGRTAHGGRGRGAPCGRCATAVEPAGDAAPVPAVFAFNGPARRLLLALKYGNAKPVARSLGAAMARRVRHERVDVVTWAPTSLGRRRRRGYDQAELLAREVARRLGVPCRRLLLRVHGGADGGPDLAQTGRSRAERVACGPAFVARRRVRGTVLVVDDVVTTGATLRAAQQALEAAGARTVHCIAAAATPAAM